MIFKIKPGPRTSIGETTSRSTAGAAARSPYALNAATHKTQSAYSAGGLQAALDAANAGGKGAIDATSATPGATRTSTQATPAWSTGTTPRAPASFRSRSSLEGVVSAFGRPAGGATTPVAALTVQPPSAVASAVASAAALLPARAATRAATRAHDAAARTDMYDSYEDAPGDTRAAAPGATLGTAPSAAFGAAPGATAGAPLGAVPGTVPLFDVLGKRGAVPLATYGAQPSRVFPSQNAVNTLLASGAGGALQPAASTSAATAATEAARTAPVFDTYGDPLPADPLAAAASAAAPLRTTTPQRDAWGKSVAATGSTLAGAGAAAGTASAFDEYGDPLSATAMGSTVSKYDAYGVPIGGVRTTAATAERGEVAAAWSGTASLRGSGSTPLAAAPGRESPSTAYASGDSTVVSSLLGDLDRSSSTPTSGASAAASPPLRGSASAALDEYSASSPASAAVAAAEVEHDQYSGGAGDYSTPSERAATPRVAAESTHAEDIALLRERSTAVVRTVTERAASSLSERGSDSRTTGFEEAERFEEAEEEEEKELGVDAVDDGDVTDATPMWQVLLLQAAQNVYVWAVLGGLLFLTTCYCYIKRKCSGVAVQPSDEQYNRCGLARADFARASFSAAAAAPLVAHPHRVSAPPIAGSSSRALSHFHSHSVPKLEPIGIGIGIERGESNGSDGAAGMSDSWNDEGDWGGNDDGGDASPPATTSKWSAPKAKAKVEPKKTARVAPRALPRHSPSRIIDEASDRTVSPLPTETVDELLSTKARRQLPVAKKAMPLRVGRVSARPLPKPTPAAAQPSARSTAKAKAAALSKPVMPKLEKPSYDFFAELDLTPTYKSSASSTALRGGSAAKAEAAPLRVTKGQTAPTPPATSSFVRFVQRCVFFSFSLALSSALSCSRALVLTYAPPTLHSSVSLSLSLSRARSLSLLPPLCSSRLNRLQWTMRATMISVVRAGAPARILIWATTTEGANKEQCRATSEENRAKQLRTREGRSRRVQNVQDMVHILHLPRGRKHNIVEKRMNGLFEGAGISKRPELSLPLSRSPARSHRCHFRERLAGDGNIPNALRVAVWEESCRSRVAFHDSLHLVERDLLSGELREKERNEDTQMQHVRTCGPSVRRAAMDVPEVASCAQRARAARTRAHDEDNVRKSQRRRSAPEAQRGAAPCPTRAASWSCRTRRAPPCPRRCSASPTARGRAGAASPRANCRATRGA